MGIKTKIEWCDSTINPIMGCSGCALRKDHCYAATLCTRHAGRKGWPRSFDHPEFFPGRLEKAIRWKDLTGTKRPDKPWLDGHPRIIFVNDLSDGFCPDVDPEQWLLFNQMAASPHIFLLLTKWPDRMATVFGRWGVPDNIWLGTSITTQKDADERIPWLLRIQAAVHFVSLEPLLGPLRLRDVELMDGDHLSDSLWHAGSGNGIDWIIVGGETGHGARPMPPDATRSLRDQCVAAGVPYFFKSWGEWLPNDQFKHSLPDWRGKYGPDGWEGRRSAPCHHWHLGFASFRVGRKQAGRLLDGEEWNEMPRGQR